MRCNHGGGAVTAIAAAALAAVTLAGCSVGPVDLGALDGLLSPTSVAEARAQRRSELVATVSDDLLVQAGTLTVGIKSTESAPLSIALPDGSSAGIDVDTAYALADELGLASVSFVSVPDAAAGLADGCDVVMGVEADEADGVAVVGSYVQSALGLFAGRGAAASSVPADAADLAGATVGVQAGSVSQSALSKLDLDIAEATYLNLNEAFEALEAGEVDYVACDACSGAYLACAYEDVAFVGTLDDPVAVGVGVSADAADLQAAVAAAVDEIQANGVAGIAKARWVGALPTLVETTKVTNVVERSDERGAEDADAPADGGAADVAPAE